MQRLLLAFLLVAIPSIAMAQPPELTSVSPTSGSPLGGETVTLNGTNFTPARNKYGVTVLLICTQPPST